MNDCSLSNFVTFLHMFTSAHTGASQLGTLGLSQYWDQFLISRPSWGINFELTSHYRIKMGSVSINVLTKAN